MAIGLKRGVVELADHDKEKLISDTQAKLQQKFIDKTVFAIKWGVV